MEKEMSLLRKYQKLYRECGGAASFLTCFLWYVRWIDHQIFINQPAYMTLGNIAFSVVLPMHPDTPADATCVLPHYHAMIKRICRRSGYTFEFVEKFGGVYNFLYFKNRILKQLRQNKPVLFCGTPYDRQWHVLIGYREDTNAIRYLSNHGIFEATDWYKHMNEILILNSPSANDDTGFETRMTICRALTEQMRKIPGFYTGETAYAIWVSQLLENPKYTHFNLWMLQHLLAVRRSAHQMLCQFLLQYPDAGPQLRPAMNGFQRLLSIQTEGIPLDRAVKTAGETDRQIMQALACVFL